MNINTRLSRMLLLLAFALLGTVVPAFAQGTAFTYQGRLDDGASPATGIYDLRFAIYDALASGSQIGGTLTSTATAVSNGLFTVTLDFGAGVFTGADRWLDIGVRTNGGGAFTTLIPRQAITPTPYAITAANLAAGASPTFTGTPSFNAPSGPPFMVSNNAKVPNLNADLLDGLDSTELVLKAGDTMTGDLTIAGRASLNFGSTTRQMLNLWGLGYGIGVQTGTLYFRADASSAGHGGFGWYRGGTHSTPCAIPAREEPY